MNKSLVAALLAVVLPLPVVAQDTVAPAPKPAVLKLGVGFDYSHGDYGFSQDTEVSSVPVNLSYDQNRWSFKASIPYLTIKGPASVAAGTTPIAAPGRPTTNSESGMGDATVSATYHANPKPGQLNVDFTTRVKLPTADEDKGLGTGETDYYFQADLYQAFGDIIPFASFGYRMMGTSAMYPLEDGFYVTIGSSYRLTQKTVIGAAYDWRAKIIEGAENGTDMIAFIATNPNPNWSLLAYTLIGFNDASPELGLGGLATYKF
ncbi:MAG TPA: hypothetical protein VEA63_14720 [Opitutus sp.]|nr:hypothetical protein [Opitutus sp.]